MNSLYRLIWNSTQGRFVAPSEPGAGKNKQNLSRALPLSALSASLLMAFSTLGHAAEIVVDGTTYSDSGLKASAGNNNPVLQVINGGEATWGVGELTASGTGAGAVLVQSASTLNLNGTSLSSLQANTPALALFGGSVFNSANSQVSALGNSVALSVNEGSQIRGDGLRVRSAGTGMRVTDSQVDISNLDVGTTGVSGYGVHTLGASTVNIHGGTINTSNTGASGIHATGGTVTATGLSITASGASSRGVVSTGAGTRVSLDGGSINTIGANAYGVQSTRGAILDVKNMDITTTQGGQPGFGGGAAVFVDVGGTVNLESTNLTAPGVAVWIREGTVNGNNVYMKKERDAGVPVIWGFGGSHLNLTNSEIDLAAQGAQAIYNDGGTATLDNVRIQGDQGGIGLVNRYGGTTVGNNVDIEISGSDTNWNNGIIVSNGASDTSVTLENSRVVVNGSNAIALLARTRGLQRIQLKNTVVSTDNVVINANDLVEFDVTVDGSTLEGKTLMAGGAANSGGLQVTRVQLDASNGSRLKGDVAIDRDYNLDSAVKLNNVSTWEGASAGLHRLELNGGSAWTMTGDSSVGAMALQDSRVNFDHSNGVFKTLTVGDLSGNGSFLLNTDLASVQGDLLKIEGQVSGEHTLIVADSGHEARGDALMLVDGNGGAGKFDLYGGKVDVGAFRYGLEQRGDDWYLAGTAREVDQPETPAPQPENLSKGSNAAIGQQAAATALIGAQMNAPVKRLGELRMGEDDGGLWTRGFTKEQHIDTGSSRAFQQQVNGFELGADKAIPFYNGKLYLGGMVGKGEARQDFGEGSKGTIDSAMLGTYATYVDQSGVYVDSVLKYTHLENKVDMTSNVGEKIDGKYKNHAVAVDVEVGKQIDLGKGWFVEPQVELQAFRVGSADYTSSNGLKVEQDSVTSVQSRVGSLFGRNLKLDNGMTVQPYAKASWITEHAGDSHVNVNGVRLDSKLPGSRAEVGGGVILQTAQKHKFYLDAEYSKGNGIEQPYAVNLGYRYTW